MPVKLSFQQVSFDYGQVPLIRDLSFEVKQGEFISLVGPSGIGKSTLFQLATGLLQPSSGEISIDGRAAANRLGKVAYMPQQDLLMPWRTVLANAALPLEIQGLSPHQAKQIVLEKLPVFGLSEYANVFPHQLSGGMRQRVSLLRATLTGSDLLLLDEPFSSLDGITRMEMQEWLLQLWRGLGSTVMMITHDLEEAMLLSDRVLVIKDRPIRTVTDIFIPIERCNRSSARYDPSFLTIREQIWQALQSSTHQQFIAEGRI